MNPELLSESTEPVGTSVSAQSLEIKEDKYPLLKKIITNILILFFWCIIAVVFYYIFLRQPTSQLIPRGKPFCDYPESIGKPIYSSKIFLSLFTFDK